MRESLLQFTRIDADTGEESPCDAQRAMNIIRDHYLDPYLVLDNAMSTGEPIRCTFASYRVTERKA